LVVEEAVELVDDQGYLGGEAPEHAVDAVGDVGPELRREEVARHGADHHCGGSHRGRRREHRLGGGQVGGGKEGHFELGGESGVLAVLIGINAIFFKWEKPEKDQEVGFWLTPNQRI